MSDYWFARYKPGLPQNASRGLVPLNWKGVATIAGFVASLVAGGALFLYFGLHDEFIVGIPLFVVLAIAGFVLFIWASVAKTDPNKSIYEYRAEQRK
jgi:hypothetical protein